MRPTPDLLTALPARAPAQSTAASGIGQEILRRFRALAGYRRTLLRHAADVASASSCALYWVGGGVRDLWLGASEPDLDLVIEGDLPSFARRFAAELGSQLRLHPQFMTAELRAAGGFRVDLARARSESYSSPASLPVVAPGTMAGDYLRRDFTINCLAIPLAPGFGDRLIDPCDGLHDLARGHLRTLHRDSFRDDPTRILRGLEFAARFGFELAPETLREAENAIASGAVAQLSSPRLGAALKRALGRSATASEVIRRMGDLALLEAIDGGLAHAAGTADRFDRALAETVGGPSGESFRLALLCLALELDAAERPHLARRLSLALAEGELMTDGPERVREALVVVLHGESRPSSVHACLERLSFEELAIVAAQGDGAREWVRREIAEFRNIRLEISGRDLLAAGLTAGPGLGRALQRTLEAKLDGQIDDGSVLEFALRAARSETGGETS